jgi:Fic family protein
MLCDIQREIFTKTNKTTRDIGEIRKHHVWIGDEGLPITEARFVPAPGDDRLKSGLDDLVDWIGRDSDLPPVLRAAMTHYQFETLHPFSDGNGRIGRLVIILQLLRSKSVAEPVITVSPWFNDRKQQYKDHLLELSCTGDWNPWVTFFCDAIIDQSQALITGAEHIDSWLKETTKNILQRRWTGTIHEVVKDLAAWPKLTISSTAEKYSVAPITATTIVNHLCEIGVLTETTGRSYGRVFVAQEVMDIVEAI